MPVGNGGFSWFWFVGSVAADLDHLFILYYYKIFSWARFIDVIRFEEKYGMHFKTKYFHSIFGALITSAPIVFISKTGALYYFIAYVIHLFLDWPDIDEKQYLYPLKHKFRGFLPIFSKLEIIFTFLLAGFYLHQAGFLALG